MSLLENRESLRRAFMSRIGWGSATITPLAADASFRRYFRLYFENKSAILLDEPSRHNTITAVKRISRHLNNIGLSAPKVYCSDVHFGFALLEDFGDGTFSKCISVGDSEVSLYSTATDLLIALHRMPLHLSVPVGCKSYGAGFFLEEISLFFDWYLPYVLGQKLNTGDRYCFLNAWLNALLLTLSSPRSLVIRDFHVDNLMKLSNREGIRSCGLLDFQDALTGSTVYDLVSLLEDARRDVDYDLKQSMKERYLAGVGTFEDTHFDAIFSILAAQRHAKVIGIFTRLCNRDGKPGYLTHIPRLWTLFEHALMHPRLKSVRDWIDGHVPPSARRIPDVVCASN